MADLTAGRPTCEGAASPSYLAASATAQTGLEIVTLKYFLLLRSRASSVEPFLPTRAFRLACMPIEMKRTVELRPLRRVYGIWLR